MHGRMLGVATAVAALAMPLDAQTYSGLLPAQLEWSLVSGHHEQAVFRVRFRNVSGYTQGQGGFWTLYGIHAVQRNPFGGGCDGPCDMSWGFGGTIGKVDLSDLGVPGGNPMQSELGIWNFWDGGYGGGELRAGPGGETGGWMSSQNIGLLGCTIPLFADEAPRHAGRTCLADGFDGWLEGFILASVPAGLTLSAEDLVITPMMQFRSSATIPVPTPATGGLLVIGAVQLFNWRRRDAARRPSQP